MDYLINNLSTVVVGALVFGLLGLVLFRLVRRIRRGQSACGCENCGGCRRAGGNKPVQANRGAPASE
ncbi:MAG: FeoB-associated Cys-rich membrane protein [Treponema sp.]|jgi:hypothetical protein|nr:FeoB-associated Cys-rich membrane protein [Treponema sp.]